MGELAIKASGLGKRYRIGAASSSTNRTLRESLVDAVTAPWKRVKSVLTGQAARTSQDIFWALRGVDLEVPVGSALGIIGRNGSGKSTLLKVLSRITPPTEGEVLLRGRVGSLLEVGTGFHPELSGRENIYLNGAILGMTKREISLRFDEIVDFSGVAAFLDTPVKHYSSGMYVRLAFSVAAHLEPEILLVDEVLAVGDAAFQRKCIERMQSVADEGRTVLFVSHNLTAVRNLCDQAIWLDDGRIRERGPATGVIDTYLSATVRAESLEDVAHALDQLPDDPAIRVNAVDVRQSGRSTTLVGNGDPIELAVDFTVKGKEPGLRLYWDLLDGDRNLLIRTFHDDQSARPSALEPGRYCSVAVLPKDLLAPHRYELRLHATVYNVRQCLGADGLGLTLDVERSNDLNQAYPSEPVRSKLKPRIEWKTESLEPKSYRSSKHP